MADFEAFRAQFKGDIVTPRDTNYEEAIDRWSANAKRRAAVVAFVKDSGDVALAIRYARTAGLLIAIRGGGHSAAGTSSSEGGLVIDLSKYLNNVRVDPGKKLAYTQGGASWKAVDEATVGHGLAGVAGTVNHTGVGGLAVGGGYGWLSGAHGLAIDNIVQATVVTADGKILKADETENSDLFWGIRGGGSNFGVVTEFVFKIHPQRRRVFAGKLIFPVDKIEKISAFLNAWWPNIKADEGMQVHMTRFGGNPVITAFIFYNGSEDEGRKNFRDLLDIGPTAGEASEIAYEELNALTNPTATWGSSYYFKGTLLSEKPSQDINMLKFQNILDVISSSEDHLVTVMHEYMPHGKINSVPSDATPYRRDLPGNALIKITWQEDSPEKYLKAKEIAHAIAEIMPKGQAYGNYAPDSDALPTTGAVHSDKSRELFGKNYPRLQGIKKKYDPDMVFRKWFNIIPA